VRARVMSLLLAAHLTLATAPAVFAADRAAPLQVDVDATEAFRGILHSRVTLAVQPGERTLVYPKWIQGEHAPSGPIGDFTGLTIRAGGRTLAWTRDPMDMFAIHVTVPAGVTKIEVALDALQNTEGRYSAGASTSSQLAIVTWNQLLVYPGNTATDAIDVAARLRVPAGWEIGTALERAGGSGDQTTFKTVSLTELVDSPVQIGAHHRHIDLSPGQTPPHAIELACDSEAGLAASPELVASWRRLVQEGGALFGARHYRRYVFLFSLSDDVAHFGLEHHESSDNRLKERALLEPELHIGSSDLLSHEYVHSWIGKYRRPEGLVRSDFQQPLETGGLWVYEGLTEYLGSVLATRSGLAPLEFSRELWAYRAATLDAEPGRAWRPLEDTAIAAQILYESPDTWGSWRRGTDFYWESALIWLEADVLIRQKSGGTRSLDDFCKRFAGPPGGTPALSPHSVDDVVQVLNDVTPYDWRGFLSSRLDSITLHAPQGGFTGGGWKLGWADTLTTAMVYREKVLENVDETFTLGIMLDKDGKLVDVLRGSPAEKAGLAPGMKLIAVNGRKYTGERLREDLRASKGKREPFTVIAEQGDFVRSYAIDWHGGARYPLLVRDPSKPDLLTEIFSPRTPVIAPEATTGHK
jgi:predicted metalloprotease with PDZ domain